MKKVLCHGCFETLHEGHIDLFKIAKSYGYLIVGLEPDSYLVKKKNREPLKFYAERERSLQGTGLVDEIFEIKAGQNYLSMYKDLAPDILVTAKDEILEKKRVDADLLAIELIVTGKVSEVV